MKLNSHTGFIGKKLEIERVQKIKNVIVFVFIVLSRLCWAGMAYSVVGLLLGFFNYGNYQSFIENYVCGLIICLVWLLIIPVFETYLMQGDI